MRKVDAVFCIVIRCKEKCKLPKQCVEFFIAGNVYLIVCG